jgi:hypothetical protein
VKYPDTAPLPIVGWSCFEYVGYEWSPVWYEYRLVARYVIPCGPGRKWAEIEATRRQSSPIPHA